MLLKFFLKVNPAVKIFKLIFSQDPRFNLVLTGSVKYMLAVKERNTRCSEFTAESYSTCL